MFASWLLTFGLPLVALLEVLQQFLCHLPDAILFAPAYRSNESEANKSVNSPFGQNYLAGDRAAVAALGVGATLSPAASTLPHPAGVHTGAHHQHQHGQVPPLPPPGAPAGTGAGSVEAETRPGPVAMSGVEPVAATS